MKSDQEVPRTKKYLQAEYQGSEDLNLPIFSELILEVGKIDINSRSGEGDIITENINYLSKFHGNLLVKPTFWGEDPASEVYLQTEGNQGRVPSRFQRKCVYDIRLFVIDQRNKKSVGIVFINCQFFLNKRESAEFPLKKIEGFFPVYKFPCHNGKAEKVGELKVHIHMSEPETAMKKPGVTPQEKAESEVSGRKDLESKKEELLRTMNEARQFLLDQDIQNMGNDSKKEGDLGPGNDSDNMKFLMGNDSEMNRSILLKHEMGNDSGLLPDPPKLKPGKRTKGIFNSEDELVSCKSRTATLEAELFQLKNKYKNFLTQKENVEQENVNEEIVPEPESKEEAHKFHLDFRLKMENLKTVDSSLEADLSEFNCILEVSISCLKEEEHKTRSIIKGSIQEKMFRISKTITIPDGIKFDNELRMKCQIKMIKSGKEIVLARGSVFLNEFAESSILNAVEYKPFKVKLKPIDSKKKNRIIRRQTKSKPKSGKREFCAFLSCFFVITKSEKALKSPRTLLSQKKTKQITNSCALKLQTPADKTKIIQFAVQVKNFEGEVASVLEEHTREKRFLYFEYNSLWENRQVSLDRIKILKDIISNDHTLTVNYYQISSLVGDLFEQNPNKLFFLKLISKNKDNEKTLIGFMKIGLSRLRERFFELVKTADESVWTLKPEYKAPPIEKLDQKDVEVLSPKGQILGFAHFELWVGSQKELMDNQNNWVQSMQARTPNIHSKVIHDAPKRETTPEPTTNPVVSHRFPELSGDNRFVYDNTFGNNKMFLNRKGISDILPRRFITSDKDWKSIANRSKKFSNVPGLDGSGIMRRSNFFMNEEDRSVAISKELKIPKLEGLGFVGNMSQTGDLHSVLDRSQQRNDLINKNYQLTDRISLIKRESNSRGGPSLIRTVEDRFSENFGDLDNILRTNSENQMLREDEHVIIDNPFLTQMVSHFKENYPEIDLNQIRNFIRPFASYENKDLIPLPIERIDLFLMFWNYVDLSEILILANISIKNSAEFPEFPDNEFKLEFFSEPIIKVYDCIESIALFSTPRNKEVLLSVFNQLLTVQLGLDDRLILNKEILPSLHKKHMSTYFEPLFNFFVLLKTHDLSNLFTRLAQEIKLFFNVENLDFQEASSINEGLDQADYENSLNSMKMFFEANANRLKMTFLRFLEISQGFSNFDIECLESSNLVSFKSLLCFSSISNFFRILDSIFQYVLRQVLKEAPEDDGLDDHLFGRNNQILEEFNFSPEEAGLSRQSQTRREDVERFNMQAEPVRRRVRNISEDMMILTKKMFPGLTIFSSYQESIIVKLKFDIHFQEIVDDQEEFIYKIIFLFANEVRYQSSRKSPDKFTSPEIMQRELDLGLFLSLRLIDQAYFSSFSLLEFIYFYRFLCKFNGSDCITLEQLVSYFQEVMLTMGSYPEASDLKAMVGRMLPKIKEEMSQESGGFASKLKTWRDQSAQKIVLNENAKQKVDLLENFISNFSIHEQNIRGSREGGANGCWSQRSGGSQFGGCTELRGVYEEGDRSAGTRGDDDVRSLQILGNEQSSRSRFIEEGSKSELVQGKQAQNEIMNRMEIESINSEVSSTKQEGMTHSESNKEGTGEKEKNREKSKENSHSQAPPPIIDPGVPCEILGIELQSIRSPSLTTTLHNTRLCLRYSFPNLCSGHLELIDSQIVKNIKGNDLLNFFVKSENILPTFEDCLSHLENNDFPNCLEIQVIKVSRTSLKVLASGRLPLSNLTRMVASKEDAAITSDIVLTRSDQDQDLFGDCTVQVYYRQEYHHGKEFRVKRRFPKEGLLKVEVLEIMRIDNVFGYLDALEDQAVLESINGQEVSLEVEVSPKWKTLTGSDANVIVQKDCNQSKNFRKLVIQSPQKPRREGGLGTHNMSLSQLSEQVHSTMRNSIDLIERPSDGQAIPYYFEQSQYMLWKKTVFSLEELIQLLKNMSEVPLECTDQSVQCYLIPDISKPSILNFLLKGCLDIKVSLKFSADSRITFGFCQLDLDKIFEISSIEGKDLKEEVVDNTGKVKGEVRLNISYLPELMEFTRKKQEVTNVFDPKPEVRPFASPKGTFLKEEFSKMNTSYQIFEQKMNTLDKGVKQKLSGPSSVCRLEAVPTMISPSRQPPGETRSTHEEPLRERSISDDLLMMTSPGYSNLPSFSKTVRSGEEGKLTSTSQQEYSNALATLKELRNSGESEDEIPSDLLAFMKQEVLHGKESNTEDEYWREQDYQPQRVFCKKEVNEVKEIELHEETSLRNPSFQLEHSLSSGKKTAIEEYKEYLMEETKAFKSESDFYKPAPALQGLQLRGQPSQESFKEDSQKEQLERELEQQLEKKLELSLEEEEELPALNQSNSQNHALIFQSDSEDYYGREIDNESEKKVFFKEDNDSFTGALSSLKKKSVISKLPKNLFKKEELERIEKILASDRFGIGNKLGTINSDTSDSEGF